MTGSQHPPLDATTSELATMIADLVQTETDLSEHRRSHGSVETVPLRVDSVSRDPSSSHGIRSEARIPIRRYKDLHARLCRNEAL